MNIKLLTIIASALTLTACQPPNANNANCTPTAPATPQQQAAKPAAPAPKPAQSAPAVASTGKTVAIDIGHDRVKHGALSATGHSEFSFNLAFARILKAEMERQGYRAFLINEQGAQIELNQRTAQAAQGNADVMLSIHHDSAAEHDLIPWTHNGKKLDYANANKGFSLFVNKANWDNVKLAASIGRGLNEIGLVPTHYHKGRWPLINKDRGIYNRPSLAVLRTATMPTVLVEVGVIKHREEEKLLLNNAHKAKLAKAVTGGVTEYFSGSQ